jgi:hypothetical protein
MHVIRGIRQGQRATLARIGSEGFTIKEDPTAVLSPLLVRLESADEVEQFWQDPNSETFWRLFELQPDLTFKKKHSWH